MKHWSCTNNCENCKWIEYKNEYPFCILTQKQVALFNTCFMHNSSKKDFNFDRNKNTLSSVDIKILNNGKV